MTIALTCFYVLAMLILGVAFLVDWIRNYRQIRRYLKYGLAIGLILVGLNLAALVMAPSLSSGQFLLNLAIVVVVFARAVVFTMLGMYCCAWLGYPSFSLAKESFAASDALPPSEDAPCPASSPWDEEQGDAEDVVDQSPQDDHLPVADEIVGRAVPAFDGKRCALHVTLVVFVSVLYSTVLFTLTSPKISEMAKSAFGLGDDAVEAAGTVTPQLVLVLLTFAFGEEIFFRLGIQNFLARYLHWQGRKYWLAIVMTTCLWTLGHAGALEPGWVKIAQVFPLGLLLGWLFKKYGVESAIGAHAFFNLFMTLLWTPLMR